MPLRQGEQKLDEKKASLQGIEIFDKLQADDLESLSQRCSWRRYTRHQEIIGHRSRSTDVFFIKEGQVRVILYSFSGREVTFRDMGAGESFGELAAIDRKPRSANVVALSDSIVGTMSATLFWDVLQRHPSAAATVLRRMAGQLRDTSERLFELSTLGVRNRIQAELLRLARAHAPQDNRAEIAPFPIHSDIASRVSTHREAVTRELNDLTRKGLIERRSRRLVVNDIARLQKMVESVTGEPTIED